MSHKILGPLLVTVPHSGETIPPEASWLQSIDPLVLLTDVDRFVDQLYQPACQELGCSLVSTSIHRYAVDLNRLPTDIDATLVQGAPAASKQAPFVSGFHWAQTTQGHPLLRAPISMSVHQRLTALYHDSFHQAVEDQERLLIDSRGLPRYHIDAHSMPSQGTGAHKDAGQKRPDIVVSDFHGQCSGSEFKDLVIKAYEQQGFAVSYNWPYLGGRMTQRYGRPHEGRHTVQVELNRALYMDEKTKLKNDLFDQTQMRIKAALVEIAKAIS